MTDTDEWVESISDAELIEQQAARIAELEKMYQLVECERADDIAELEAENAQLKLERNHALSPRIASQRGEIRRLEAENARLRDVVEAATGALRKLDYEFHNVPGVAHLQGWAEANRLRDALDALKEPHVENSDK